MQIVFTLLLAVLLQAIAGLIVTLPTWLLWNWIAVSVFSFPSMTLIQTFGLVVLMGLLFGTKLTVNRS